MSKRISFLPQSNINFCVELTVQQYLNLFSRMIPSIKTFCRKEKVIYSNIKLKFLFLFQMFIKKKFIIKYKDNYKDKG